MIGCAFEAMEFYWKWERGPLGIGHCAYIIDRGVMKILVDSSMACFHLSSLKMSDGVALSELVSRIW